MPPITKFWLFHLPASAQPTSTPFQSLFDEILDLTTSFTNPNASPNVPQMHFLYEVVSSSQVRDGSSCMMITGYPSLEMNLECDRIYAQRFMERMNGDIGVKHGWLRMIESDLGQMELGDEIIVDVGMEEIDRGDGLGGWDVLNKEAKEGDQAWVHVSKPDDLKEDTRGTERYMLRKLMAR